MDFGGFCSCEFDGLWWRRPICHDFASGSNATSQPASSQPAQSSQSSSDLPRDTASSVGVPQTEVDAVLDHIFIDAATQAAVVSKNGVIIGERYADGYDANRLGTSWSVAKSFYSAAMGVAIAEGRLVGSGKSQHRA